jgi:hypothetical protein
MNSYRLHPDILIVEKIMAPPKRSASTIELKEATQLACEFKKPRRSTKVKKHARQKAISSAITRNICGAVPEGAIPPSLQTPKPTRCDWVDGNVGFTWLQ